MALAEIKPVVFFKCCLISSENTKFKIMKRYICFILFLICNHTIAQVIQLEEELHAGEFSEKSDKSAIETISKLDVGAKANYISEKRVHLGVGFRAKKGANFKASIDKMLAESYSLEAFPNPFVEDITTKFALNGDAMVSLLILNTEGKTMEIILDKEFIRKGIITKKINISRLPSGIYFLSLFTNRTKQSLKIVKQ